MRRLGYSAVAIDNNNTAEQNTHDPIYDTTKAPNTSATLYSVCLAAQTQSFI